MSKSLFAQKFTSHSGIVELMDDLGKALAHNDVLMLGGGNPAHIPEMDDFWRKEMEAITEDHRAFASMIGDYDPPEGNIAFIRVLVEYFHDLYGWNISEKNICLTNGSQQAFFILFNLLAGEMSDGNHKKILFPIIPEYIGYLDSGLSEKMFLGHKPHIEKQGKHGFKYHVDFETLSLDDSIAALCISRPTNPSANVVSQQELEKLSILCKEHKKYFIIDNAYGAPFPQALFSDTEPLFDDHIILSMSLSKLGLPTTRTGILIAHENIISQVSTVNSIMGLTTGGIGANMAKRAFETRTIQEMCTQYIKPYYAAKSTQAKNWLTSMISDDIPYRIHANEGAFFLWLWCEDLPISSYELYNILKKKGVIVVPGHYFFTPEHTDWKHIHECLRISFVQNDDIVQSGLQVIADTLHEIYQK